MRFVFGLFFTNNLLGLFVGRSRSRRCSGRTGSHRGDLLLNQLQVGADEGEYLCLGGLHEAVRLQARIQSDHQCDQVAQQQIVNAGPDVSAHEQRQHGGDVVLCVFGQKHDRTLDLFALD